MCVLLVSSWVELHSSESPAGILPTNPPPTPPTHPNEPTHPDADLNPNPEAGPGSYRGSFPGDSPDLVGVPAQLVEAQSLGRGGEGRVAEEFPSGAALRPQSCEVLVQVPHRVGVGAEARGQGALLGQSGRHAGHDEDPEREK